MCVCVCVRACMCVCVCVCVCFSCVKGSRVLLCILGIADQSCGIVIFKTSMFNTG